MKKKIILKVFIVLLCTSIPYLFVSFVLWNFDASQYGKDMRFIVALVTFIMCAFSSAIMFYDPNKY